MTWFLAILIVLFAVMLLGVCAAVIALAGTPDDDEIGQPEWPTPPDYEVETARHLYLIDPPEDAA